MRTGHKIFLFGGILTLMLFLIFGGGKGNSSSERTKENASQNVDAAKALSEAANLLDGNAPTAPSSEEAVSNGYDIAEPKNTNPYITSVSIGNKGQGSQPLREEEGPDTSSQKSDLSENPVSGNSDNRKSVETGSDEWREKRLSSRNETVVSESNSAPEHDEMSEFYNDIKQWSSKRYNPTQARIKAYSIRQNAAELRKKAASADPESREKLLQEAEIMDDYANRISSTRGNSRKIRALRAKILKDSGD